MRTKLKILMIVSLSLIWLALLPGVCLGATYYLDAELGDDNNPGTSELPWKSLNRAYTRYDGAGLKVQEGDTVIFRNGNYGTFRENTDDGSQYHFHRSDWVTYKAAVGHNPTLTSVSIKSYSAAGDGESYLIFDGFEITGAVSISYTSYVQVRNCNIRNSPALLYYPGLYTPYVLPGGVVIIGVFTHDVTLENNDISYTCVGINMRGNAGTYNIIIRNNTIYRLGEDGIQVYGNNILIEGNTIYDIHNGRAHVYVKGTKTGEFIEGETVIQEGTGEQGIVHTPSGDLGSYALATFMTTESRFSESGGTITGQTSGAAVSNITKVDGAHTDAIQIHTEGIRDIVIRGNTIIREYGGQQAIKLNTVTPGGTLEDIIIENNLVWAKKPIMGEGIINVIRFNSNTFYSVVDGDEGNGIVNNDLNITNMYNNIFGCGQGISAVTNHGNNIFKYEPTGFSRNSTELVYYPVENLFVNSAGGDFHLAEDSLARDFGDPLYAPAEDIEGNPRDAKPDAGCYEYVTSTFIYGDINGNGEVTSYDAALVARYAVGLEVFTDEQRQKADVSGNGEVSAYDAALIAQKAVGLIDRFPVEE